MTTIRTMREDVEELRERVGTLEQELTDVKDEIDELRRSVRGTGQTDDGGASALGCLVMIALAALIIWVFFK
jgi:FtsZ-binding cell division protein ZapB